MESNKQVTNYIKQLWRHDAIQNITYDHVPIWWFFKRRLESGVFPCFIMADLFKKKRGIIIAEFFFLRKLIYLNERLKIKVLQCMKKKPVCPSNPPHFHGRILFLLPSKALISQGTTPPTYFFDRVGRLYQEFKKQGDPLPFLCVTDPFSNCFRFSLLKMPHLLYSFSDALSQKKLKKDAQRISNQWKQIKEYLRSENKEYFPHLEPLFDFFFSFEMVHLTLLHYETYKKIIGDYGIKAVLVYGNGPAERTAIMAAHSLTIPSIGYLHGFGFPIQRWDFPTNHFILANGILEKEAYVKNGAPRKNIHLIGPLFLFGEVVHSRLKKIVQKISLSKKQRGKKRILLLTSPVEKDGVMSSEAYRLYLRQMIQKNLSGPDVEILLKPHPLENNTQAMYGDFAPFNVKQVPKHMDKYDFYTLLSNSDIILSAFSTAILETILITDVPLILLEDLYRENRINQHPFFNCIPSVKGTENFSGLIKKILFDKKFKKSLVQKRRKIRKLYPLHTDPVTNAVRFTREIIKNSHKLSTAKNNEN